MSEMVGRVARAIESASDEVSLAFTESSPHDTHTIALCRLADTAKRLAQAHAAIEAMRYPTGAMMLAAIRSEQRLDEGLVDVNYSVVASDIWPKMIDAALQ